MTVRVLLKDSKVTRKPGFVEEKRRDQSGNEYSVYSLPNGIRLFVENERWYVALRDLNDWIPKTIEKLVEQISFHGSFDRVKGRELGIYRHKTAEAEVGIGSSGYLVDMKASKLEDARELFLKIRTGEISRPESSFEGEQNGMSRQQLEQELATISAKAGELEQQTSDLRSELSLRTAEVAVLKAELEARNAEVHRLLSKIEELETFEI
ncbi:MAG: hypothetical protein ACD_15C00194G0007 [uncultured bacterium]|nr:MAG: hypothetical protein ACD_15C00194G0007 [uncultured bacterium]HBD04889.1 hypothetical protein [Candidatus Uhrbacteria bacterium]